MIGNRNNLTSRFSRDAGDRASDANGIGNCHSKSQHRTQSTAIDASRTSAYGHMAADISRPNL
jgi:hypothetical protein